MNTSATRSSARAGLCVRPTLAPQHSVARIPRRATETKAVTELATLAAGAIMTPIYGVPSAAAIYLTARYLIPAYQNYAPIAKSAVPEDMPDYKHRSRTTVVPKMKHGKKAPGGLKSTGTARLRRR